MRFGRQYHNPRALILNRKIPVATNWVKVERQCKDSSKSLLAFKSGRERDFVTENTAGSRFSSSTWPCKCTTRPTSGGVAPRKTLNDVRQRPAKALCSSTEVRSTMPRFTTMHPMYVYIHVHTSSILGRVVTPTLLGFLGRRSASLCLMTRVMRAMQNITRGGKPAAVSLHRTSFFEDRAKNVLISCWC